MSFRRRLRRLRRWSGVSRVRLSRLAGLAPGYVAMLEAGTRRPGLRAARAIAAVYGISYAWLLDGAGDAPDPGAVACAVTEEAA